MRIKQISVKKLFGMFDHDIPLNIDERITIIHGVNGIGKTVLLSLIDGIFNKKLFKLFCVNFEEILIFFNETSCLNIQKTTSKNSLKQNIKISFNDASNKKKSEFDLKNIYSNSELRGFGLGLEFRILEDYIPVIKRIDDYCWLNLTTNEKLSLEDVLGRFESQLPQKIKENYLEENIKEPDWFKKLTNLIKIRLIEHQRLLYNYNVSHFKNDLSIDYENYNFFMLPSVANYSGELAEKIKATLAEYGKLSQSLDRTFPARVIEQKERSDLTVKQLREKLIALETQRNHLIELGLLTRDENSHFQIKDDIDDSTKNFLAIYVKDVEDKLGVFTKIAAKTNLLKNIINNHFSYKKLTIEQDKGFIFTTDKGDKLLPNQLSSGEQNALVMLYELLFKTKPNSLILIDEPEISLHVEWQVHYLKDLQEIIKLANLDILIATHSPDIINERWDLTVQLKGLNK